MTKPTSTKVYKAPGYPVDPKKQAQRDMDAMPEYSCIMIRPKKIILESQTVILKP